jgi:hypothetical protein
MVSCVKNTSLATSSLFFLFQRHEYFFSNLFKKIMVVFFVKIPIETHIVDRLQNPSMISSMSFSYKVRIASKDFTRKLIPNGEPFM